MYIIRPLLTLRLGAVGCALALSFCGGPPEEEVTPPPKAAATAFDGPARYEGQSPFRATTSTETLASDPYEAQPAQPLTGCNGALASPSLFCDRSVSRWVPRATPTR